MPKRLILIIIIIAAILRFWNLERLTTFGGDQGYDYLKVRLMFTDAKPTLLGPKIGPYNQIGNLYLGPAYYYILAPSLYLANFDPIGPAALTVFFSLGTIFLIYIVANKFVSYPVALMSSATYALSSFLIAQSRAPSNPHLIPLFAAVLLFSLMMILEKKSNSTFWSFISGISLGVMFQLHYLATALIFSSVLFLIINKRLKEFVIVIVSFIVAISPQIFFELRHEFFVTNIFIRQLQNGNNISSANAIFTKLIESSNQISKLFLQNKYGTYLLIAAAFLLFTIGRKKVSENTFLLLVLNVASGILLASFYSGDIGPHYFAAIYPSLFVLFGISVVAVFKTFKNVYARAAIGLVIIFLLVLNATNLNLYSSNGYTMPKGQNLSGIKRASTIIANDVKGESFNIASTLDGDTRSMPYRYLVEVYGKLPLDEEKYPEAEVIYLISRDEEEAVRRYTVWEVASFSPFNIASKSEIQNGIYLYKLVKPQKT